MWKDATTYRQGEKDRKPRALEFKIKNGIRIVIVWNHLVLPDEWCMHIHPNIMSEYELELTKYDDIEKAKSKALDIALEIFETCTSEIKKLKELDSEN